MDKDVPLSLVLVQQVVAFMDGESTVAIVKKCNGIISAGGVLTSILFVSPAVCVLSRNDTIPLDCTELNLITGFQ